MAVTRRFYSRTHSAGGQEVFSLARDVVTDAVFVLVSLTTPRSSFPHEETTVSIADFLRQGGPGRSDLLDLIGTLVVEE